MGIVKKWRLDDPSKGESHTQLQPPVNLWRRGPARGTILFMPLIHAPGHCFQCQERHWLMAMILTQHFGKSNIAVDGPSNTLVLSSLDYYSSYMFLPLHHSHLLPQPFSITLSVLLPSISNNSFSGYHFLFSS